MTSNTLALCAALASISAILQLLHFGFQPPQLGMWLDIVASSWIIAFFLFGIRGAVLTSLVGALTITLFAPETWIGAIMKWSTTFPMLLCLYFYTFNKPKITEFYAKPINLIVPIILALILRSALALPLNYYFAIPLWTGMSTNKALNSVPWYLISGLNILQGIIDISIAWLITYKFKLSRFATRNIES